MNEKMLVEVKRQEHLWKEKLELARKVVATPRFHRVIHDLETYFGRLKATPLGCGPEYFDLLEGFFESYHEEWKKVPPDQHQDVRDQLEVLAALTFEHLAGFLADPVKQQAEMRLEEMEAEMAMKELEAEAALAEEPAEVEHERS